MGYVAALWQELSSGYPGDVELARITVRLLTAIVLGGMLGLQRAHLGKAAGMRTHMLVTLGAAVVTLLPSLVGMAPGDASRIVQGTLAGIGFIGGGAILKLTTEHHVEGVTTAASIWLTATLGVAAGSGRWGLALAAGALAMVILACLGRFEHAIGGTKQDAACAGEHATAEQNTGTNRG